MQRTRTILVVDDESGVRDMLSASLQAQGYAVYTAPDGQSALDQLRRMPRPDVILLDLLMPGMDGWEFRYRQRLDPDLEPIPVIILSAVAQSSGTNYAL